MKDNAELDVLAAFVHGFAAFANLIGLIYNVRRAKRLDLDVAVHAAALTYHAGSARKHYLRASSYI